MLIQRNLDVTNLYNFYNKDLGIMNNFVYPSNRKIYGKVP